MKSRVRTTWAPVGYCLTLPILGHSDLGSCSNVVLCMSKLIHRTSLVNIYTVDCNFVCDAT
jgi:hypothetical protein